MSKNNEKLDPTPEPVATETEKEKDRDERAKQRQVCSQYVQKLHHDFFREGAGKGFKNIKKFKERIPILCESDEGGVWTAGQFLLAQMKIEQNSKNCRFRLDPSLYQIFLKSVQSRKAELKECDIDTYNEDIEVAKTISESLPEEFRIDVESEPDGSENASE